MGQKQAFEYGKSLAKVPWRFVDATQDVRHAAHGMVVIHLESLAQVVESGFAIRAVNEPVFRALAPAKFEVPTFAANRGQGVALGKGKGLLPLGIGYRRPMGVADIAEAVVGVDVVVA